METLFSVTATFASLPMLSILLLGLVLGILLGAMPGIGASQALALLFPLTFVMDVNQAILFFLAVYSAAEYGGSIPAILIRTPGTGAAAITVLDGNAMARKGLARKALRISLYSGVVGGIGSTLIFIAAGTTLGSVALMFGPSELFAVGILGLSIIGSFFGKDAARGFLATGLGLLLATIGSSGFGGLRFTFGQSYLLDGVPFVVIVIAFLAGPEVFRLLVENRRTVEVREKAEEESADRERNRISFAEARSLGPAVFRGTLIGTAVGIIPGAGASIGSLMAYSEERRWSKRPNEFGTGVPEGVAAPEAANNAVVAGVLVPSLALGIPGSGAAAILLGVLTSKGVVPGPLMFRDDTAFVMTVFVGLIIINIGMLFVGIVGTRPFAAVTKVPRRLLGPFVLALVVTGTYTYANYPPHVIMVLVLGLIAYLLEKIDFPVVPIVLAAVMGPIIESNLNRALTIQNGDLLAILSRPITLTILLLAVLTAIYSVVSTVRAARVGAAQAANEE
jgi:putative tricarboxylic transport membrane protein